MSTKLHELGKNGPFVPALGFGLMGMSYKTYGLPPSDEERFAILDRAVELGSTFWDTAEYVSILHPFILLKPPDTQSFLGANHYNPNKVFTATMKSSSANGSEELESETKSLWEPNLAL